MYKYNGKYVAIVPKKVEAHDKIIEVLKSEEAEFHTYARKSEIKPKIVLKGLPVLPVEVISNEIHSHNIKTNSIYMLRAKTNNNLNSATYLITVDNLTTLRKMNKIKYISCIVIKWEKYIKKTEITQCYNCQKFGHGKSNCHRITICMKCACKHENKQCSLDVNSPNIKCHNCGENHMASDEKCPVHISFINNKINNINNKNKKNPINTQPRNS